MEIEKTEIIIEGQQDVIESKNTARRPRAEAEFDLQEIQSEMYGTLHFKGTLQCILPIEDFPQLNLEEVAGMDLLVHNWLNKFKIASLEEMHYEKFSQPYVLCAAFTNPGDNIIGEKMLIYYLIFAWLWRVDDYLEREFDTKEEYFKESAINHEFRKISVKILKGEYDNLSELPNNEFSLYRERCAALFDIYSRLCREIKDYHKNNYYFLKYFDNYFNGAISIHEMRGDFSERTFKLLRMYDGGTQLTAEIISMIRGIILPKHIRQNLIFKRFKMSYLRPITFTNDLIGIRKDIKINEYVNLILFKTKTSGDIRKSFFEVMNQINSDVRETIVTGALLRETFPTNQPLQEYIKLIELYSDGHIYFYQYCMRYGPVDIKITDSCLY